MLENEWRYHWRLGRVHDKTEEILQPGETSQKAESRIAQDPNRESNSIKEGQAPGKGSCP